MDCGFNSKNVNTSGPMGTFNAFNVADSVTKRIDYIFMKNMIVTDYQHINERRNNNLWLSDHLPVYCKVHF
jgi:endonuclease/exonuclease/phosphatase family metal-dependent hydrolase